VERRVAGWGCVTALFFVRLAFAQAPATSATAAFPVGSASSPAPAEPPPPADGAGDRFQISLEPYVRALFESAYVGAGFLINADEPYGPWLDTGSIWGLRVEGGARF
jgi:hypothetical protein